MMGSGSVPRPRSAGGWVSRQVAAMADAWGRGRPVTAAELIDRAPDLDDEAAIRLIYEEACLRREAGLAVDTAEFVARYPRWAAEVRDLFDCDRLFRPSGAVAAFPEPGEALGPFLLLDELGRGASGRTFLATDPTLADRPVVVKVVAGDQDEHLALAQLRHTHIVPLFSEHSLPDRGLRALCMPYLGGATLAELLADQADVPPGRRSGASLVGALDRRARPLPGAPTTAGPFRRGLENASYVDAITWIVACLADALHYAHVRGIVHMDLKPSNVLIAADGQPMLLDFHLSRGPIAAGERVVGRLGGTPGWMAPEQEAALLAAGRGLPAPAAVDGRADLYALGLLLREALLIRGDDGGGAGSPRPPEVGVSLADVVRSCLSTDPRGRYATAALLAEDLRRQLDDLPLRGVRNRDPFERWRKWRRRHPGAFAWGIAGCSALLAVAVAGTAGLAVYRERIDQARLALEEGRLAHAAGRDDEAVRLLAGGLDEARGLPAAEGVRALLDRQLRLCRRSLLADQLHELADLVRYRHGVELPGPAESRSLAELCRAVWERRARLLSTDGPSLEPEAERQIRTDLLELVAVRVDLLRRLAPPSEAEGPAVRLLDEAEAALGPCFALELRRSPSDGPAGRGSPRSAWEHYDLGRYYLRDGRIAEAAEQFGRALDERPQDFWSNFYAGHCAYRLDRFEDAAAAFRTCEALAPDSAVCPYNRGLADAALGRLDAADRDYARALELDPRLAPALLNRGLLALEAGRHRDALDDFERGLRADPDPETRDRLRDSLALARRALGDR